MLAEAVSQDEQPKEDVLDTSTIPEDNIMVDSLPTGSLQLMNGLWLAKDINKELCQECVKEYSYDDESKQFEIYLVNCYTGIPTQDLLEELGDLKKTKEVLALDISPVKE